MIITNLKFQVLKAGNYYLRKLTVDDAPDFFEFFSNEEVRKYSGGNVHKTLQDSIDAINHYNSGLAKGSHIAWGISETENSKIIGFIGVLHIDQVNCFGSFGSVLHIDYWNKGVITIAHKVITKWAFENTNLQRIESQFYEKHTAVESMLIKSGLTKEGILRSNFKINNEFLNSIVYSVTKTDYQKNKTFYDCE